MSLSDLDFRAGRQLGKDKGKERAKGHCDSPGRRGALGVNSLGEQPVKRCGNGGASPCSPDLAEALAARCTALAYPQTTPTKPWNRRTAISLDLRPNPQTTSDSRKHIGSVSMRIPQWFRDDLRSGKSILA